MSTRILITGASGFVGSKLIERLLGQDQEYIIKATYNRTKPKIRNKNLVWLKTDLLKDEEIFKHLESIDILIHLAGISNVGQINISEYSDMNNLNVDSALFLAEQAARSNVKQFILISSIAASEFADCLEINERNGLPNQPYGLSKYLSEISLKKICKEYSMKYTILRPTALFGENHKGSIYELAKLAKFGFLPIIGNESRTNFYFIDDFCDVIINVIFLEKAYNETYICSDSSLTYRDLSSHIAKNMGIRIKLLQFPLLVGYLISISLNILSRVFLRTNPLSFQRLNAISRKNIYSNKKISEQLFIKPRIGVVSGLRKTVSWFKSNGLL